MILEHGNWNKDFLFLSHLWLDLYLNSDLYGLMHKPATELHGSVLILAFCSEERSTLAEEKAGPNGNVKIWMRCRTGEPEHQFLLTTLSFFVFSFFAKWLLSEEKLSAVINAKDLSD